MNKDFDCVEMKRRAAEAIYEMLNGMSPDEELAYWQERTQALLEAQKQAREAADPSSTRRD